MFITIKVENKNYAARSESSSLRVIYFLPTLFNWLMDSRGTLRTFWCDQLNIPTLRVKKMQKNKKRVCFFLSLPGEPPLKLIMKKSIIFNCMIKLDIYVKLFN